MLRGWSNDASFFEEVIQTNATMNLDVKARLVKAARKCRKGSDSLRSLHTLMPKQPLGASNHWSSWTAGFVQAIDLLKKCFSCLIWFISPLIIMSFIVTFFPTMGHPCGCGKSLKQNHPRQELPEPSQLTHPKYKNSKRCLKIWIEWDWSRHWNCALQQN